MDCDPGPDDAIALKALAPRLRANAIFLSPPWGGVGYDAAARFEFGAHPSP